MASLEAQVEAYLAKGGKVKQCATGDTAMRQIIRGLSLCQCGCYGNYTAHSMRAGESGRDSSIIIR